MENNRVTYPPSPLLSPFKNKEYLANKYLLFTSTVVAREMDNTLVRYISARMDFIHVVVEFPH